MNPTQQGERLIAVIQKMADCTEEAVGSGLDGRENLEHALGALQIETLAMLSGDDASELRGILCALVHEVARVRKAMIDEAIGLAMEADQ